MANDSKGQSVIKINLTFKNYLFWGVVPRWLRLKGKHLTSGHDLAVCELERHTGLCADSSEPGACFGFWVSLSLPLPLMLAVTLSLSVKNK